MTSTPNDGGPAFPHQKDDGSPYWGMTKREYFAIRIMAALITQTPPESNIYGDQLAHEAARFADALIYELDQSG